MPGANHFSDVTLLITHYNRSRSLERLLESFNNLQISFKEIIVSDDASQPEHLNHLKLIQERLAFRLLTTEKNKGLANNINKGQDAVTTPYILYVQEDFVPMPIFIDTFKNAVDIIEKRKDIDVIRFWAYVQYPYLKPIANGFSEMIFNLWKPGYRKFYLYSDAPHLKRNNFLQKFGRYTEGIGSDKAEYLMMMNFLRKKGKGAIHENVHTLLEHQNSDDEPSTVPRNFLGQSSGFIVANVRHLYRHLKFNFDYLFRG